MVNTIVICPYNKLLQMYLFEITKGCIQYFLKWDVQACRHGIWFQGNTICWWLSNIQSSSSSDSFLINITNTSWSVWHWLGNNVHSKPDPYIIQRNIVYGFKKYIFQNIKRCYVWLKKMFILRIFLHCYQININLH